MAKSKTIFFCAECGNESPRWSGQCPACGAWNAMTEQPVAPKEAPVRGTARAAAAGGRVATLERLRDVPEIDDARAQTGIGEFDRVLGGGVVPGTLALIGGDPGIGKSTLLLQAAARLTQTGQRVLYATGEESSRQIRMRARRLGCHEAELMVAADTDFDAIIAAMSSCGADVLIVDSIQTMTREGGTPGGVSQIREATAAFHRLAKESGCSIFLIGHVTKEGSLAGPRVLEHMVDVVLYFEGDRRQDLRILRAIKNRYGSINEIGLFSMTGTGMMEVTNPSDALLSRRAECASGLAVHAALEGSRPLLVDVQALVSPTAYGNPRRTASGMDLGRVHLLLAVLEKRCGLRLSSQDAYINVAGGLELEEPAADLAACMATASSYRDAILPGGLMMCGEVGLAGELRAVTQLDRRIAEGKRLGFTSALIPRDGLRGLRPVEGIELLAVGSLREAMNLLLK